MKTAGVYPIYDMGLFSFLDGLFSYLSIHVFSMYLFLSNHRELKMELLIMNTLLISLIFVNFGSVILLPLAVFLILFITGIHHRFFNGMKIYNRYLIISLTLCCLDVACFSIGMTYDRDYNYYHGIHHLISFNIPIFINKCLEYNDMNTETQNNIQSESQNGHHIVPQTEQIDNQPNIQLDRDSIMQSIINLDIQPTKQIDNIVDIIEMSINRPISPPRSFTPQIV